MNAVNTPEIVRLVLKLLTIASFGFLLSGLVLLSTQSPNQIMLSYSLADLSIRLAGLQGPAFINVGFIFLISAPTAGVAAAMISSIANRHWKQSIRALALLTIIFTGLLLSIIK